MTRRKPRQRSSEKSQPVDQSTRLTRAISAITGWLGSFPAILASTFIVLLWFFGGIFVGLSNNTYQLVINTGTTIVTFLMVFIIQNTQNRDGSAVQAKLDAQSEVLKVIAEKLGCTDDENLLTKLVGVEDAPADEISRKQGKVRKAAKRESNSSSQPAANGARSR
jgi:low affinity Fe/Cu permease